MKQPSGSAAWFLVAMAGLLSACAARQPRAASTTPGVDAPPTLVIVIVVDQLSAGKLEQIGGQFHGGFRRLLEDGRRYTRCAHAHACTETGPGHATLLSGLFPSHSGIVANEWYDRDGHHDVYCAGDERPDAGRNFDGTTAVSAAQLRGENLADLIKRSNPASKIYTVAGKDRSAILTGGHHPDGVFWYSLTTGGFTSNPGLAGELPAWGGDFWGPDPTSTAFYEQNVPPEWSYPVRPGWGPDDAPGENLTYSRVSPHPLTRIDPSLVKPSDRVSTIARRVFTSPWVDRMSLEIAGRILQHADLGTDDAVDLLVVGLSGVDVVGHSYGPDSQEYLDALIRIDGWLGELMDAAVPRGRVLFALSADHGVLPLPETIPGARRIDDSKLKERLEKGIASRLGRQAEGPFVEAMLGGDVYLDRRVLTRLGVSTEAAVEAARAELMTWSEVAHVYRGSELRAASPGDPFMGLYRNSYDPARSGDLVMQPCEKCLFTTRSYGTSHGTPYQYDRDVPMILLGSGIPAGEDSAECRSVDLAPTIASQIGLVFDAPRDGRSLLAARAVDRVAPGK
ncbi:MAG TPA: alkaline phosphatase family protein [Patescibacteria group bacterium]|nr:alkaline phosphatase family protein [Patescibacteria group bacterium]